MKSPEAAGAPFKTLPARSGKPPHELSILAETEELSLDAKGNIQGHKAKALGYHWGATVKWYQRRKERLAD